MQKKVIIVKPIDHKWINKQKSEWELKSNKLVIDRLIRFYEKNKGVDPNFE